MIWIIFFIVIILISAFLAIRSMKDYAETPEDPSQYELFLIRDLTHFNADMISRFQSYLLSMDTFFSIERLYKGKESVILLYGPRGLKKSFPELKLLELEDYVLDPKEHTPVHPKVISQNDAFTWIVKPKSSQAVVKKNFLTLPLEDNQHFFWQIICSPLKNSNHFQITVRAMVADSESHEKIMLVKKYEAQLKNSGGLVIYHTGQTASSLFDSYQKRTLIPKEISPFLVSNQKILSLLDL